MDGASDRGQSAGAGEGGGGWARTSGAKRGWMGLGFPPGGVMEGGLGRLVAWPAGPSGPVGGGWPSLLYYYFFWSFVFLFCIFFLLFIFPSVVIQFKIFMHFIKLCLLHHHYLCNI